jgi:hypothetical protein
MGLLTPAVEIEIAGAVGCGTQHAPSARAFRRIDVAWAGFSPRYGAEARLSRNNKARSQGTGPASPIGDRVICPVRT